MDDSRYNAYGSHCANDAILQIPSPMGDDSYNATLYLLKKPTGDNQFEYLETQSNWRREPQNLFVVFIDRNDVERALAEQYPGYEIEEITGSDLTEKLAGKFGIEFRYVDGGKDEKLPIPTFFVSKYDDYLKQGVPKVSSVDFLLSRPVLKDPFPSKKMKIIRDTFEKLGKELGAEVVVANRDMMFAEELVITFKREKGLTAAEVKKVDMANRRLQVRFGHPVPFYTIYEIDVAEAKAEKARPEPNKPERPRSQRREKNKPKEITVDDGFICAEITKKIRSKKRTMDHPLVKHLAQAFESRNYDALPKEVLDDEDFDLFLHFDLDDEYIVTKDGVDIYLDESMWLRSFDKTIHSPDKPQKTIRELLEFVEENQCDVRLFFPDRDGLDFITVPFAQLHAYHDQMPKVVTSNIEELRALPRVESAEAESLVSQALEAIQGVPGTNTVAYVAEDEGNTVLVVEVEEVKRLSDAADTQLFARSEVFKDALPSDVTYRFKIVPPVKAIEGPER
ncbi:MAG: hypothetical protein U0R17_00805 [Acidimicrobiia bacterium]